MKERLDIYLTVNGYYKTRNKAKLAIENGDVMVDKKIINKVSYMVSDDMNIEILKESIPYVSRGGLKLEKALHSFDVDVNNCICLDIGASTGGFTDCLLQNGASKVYALDVGSNQLDSSLLTDIRIISIENTNFREIDINEYKKYNFTIITADVSFISLNYLFDNVSKIINENGYFIALIKPQFETLKKERNKNGVVTDKKIHFKVIKNIIEEANKSKLYLNKLDFSPIKGEKSGNIEYISLFSFKEKNINLIDVNQIIDRAFSILK